MSFTTLHLLLLKIFEIPHKQQWCLAGEEVLIFFQIFLGGVWFHERRFQNLANINGVLVIFGVFLQQFLYFGRILDHASPTMIVGAEIAPDVAPHDLAGREQFLEPRLLLICGETLCTFAFGIYGFILHIHLQTSFKPFPLLLIFPLFFFRNCQNLFLLDVKIKKYLLWVNFRLILNLEQIVDQILIGICKSNKCQFEFILVVCGIE